MKSGYKRLLLFEIILMIIFILNNFVSSILSGYAKIAFLLVILGLFKLFFGYEKDNHRYWKTICSEIIIYLLVYFILYYLSGIILTFTWTNYTFGFKLIWKEILPTVLTIVLGEYLRYLMLTKSEGSKLLCITTCIFFILFHLLNLCNAATFVAPITTFKFVALLLLPTISNNIFCSYVTYKAGYKPAMLYLLITELYIFFVPIIPNPNEYIYSIVQLVVPMIYLYRIYNFFRKDRDEEVVRIAHKKRYRTLIVPIIIVAFLVYITCGYFHYHAIAIGSGSMTPNILKGDVVIIEKCEGYFEDVEIGDVIAFKKDGRIIVHRLINKVKTEYGYYFYTKGDANNEPDNFQITEEMVIGEVNLKIPYIGYPAVWLNNL